MKARPILMKPEMVRALLEGRKSQTRRIVKPQPLPCTQAMRDIPGENRWWAAYEEENQWGTAYMPLGSDHQHDWECPYGVPGDLLWVRETFATWDGPTAYRADSLYPAYSGGPLVEDSDGRRCREDFGVKWKPSIHMPRKLSRLTLKLTDVRVERVQDIRYGDAMAEGIWKGTPNPAGPTLYEVWRRTWNAIYGAQAWKRNDWVWALSFEVIHQNVNAVMEAA